jgi:hypothetical protein
MTTEINGRSRVEEYRARMAEFEKSRREVEKVRREAIDELLSERKEITRQLHQLGYEGDELPAQRRPRLHSDESPATSDSFTPIFSDTPVEAGPKRRRLQRRDTEERTCPVCEMAGHDLRAHRGQAHKRRFSDDELRERGLAIAR